MVFKDKWYAIIALVLIVLGNGLAVLAGYDVNIWGLEALITPMVFAGNLLAIIFIVAYSTFVYRKYFSVILKALIAVLVIGMMFKIQHWAASDLLLKIGLLGIPTLYTVHFITKPTKHLLDFSKFLLVLSQFAFMYLHIFHLPYDEYFNIAAIAFFFSTLLIIVLGKDSEDVVSD